eukprot:TRINITY_DN75507_c0_g1_i1.p1 TRINITY_DN75507_c0_g1~~TRINITY_DN75507_c0_g1_i1.p1  ORF type:complete len:553 (+),score=89.31 TRINITY_DN75507_c0_g1_i1:58-1716(+)
MRWMCVGALLRCTIATQIYPRSEKVASRLFAVVEAGRSNEELLCLDALSGNLARRQPQIYRVNSESWETDTTNAYSVYLRDAKISYGVVVDEAFMTASLSHIVANFTSDFKGYIRCGSGDASTSAAITLAAASDGLLIAANDAVAAELDSVGLPQLHDLRGKKVNDILDDALPRLSQKVIIFQDASKIANLGDYAVFARAAIVAFNSEKDAQVKILSRSLAPAAAFGWGPENEYVSTLNEHGVYVHASDWSKNLAALSNIMWESAMPASAHESKTDASDAVHTVSFLMSDGDNIQWTLGGWLTDEKYWGNRQRGVVPLGWTFSPSVEWLAPTVLKNVLSTETSNDELVAGPSGVGYMFPTYWPADKLADFTNLTFDGMKVAGMRVVNAIGKDDNEPDTDIMQRLISDDGVDGMVYYPWGGGYSALQGKMWCASGKAIVSGRYSLWGEESSGLMLGVNALVERLKKMPKDPTSSAGYSLIPVHAWTHSYSDVVEVVNKLKAAGGFDVVLPSELVRRLRNKPSLCHGDHMAQLSPNSAGSTSPRANHFAKTLVI